MTGRRALAAIPARYGSTRFPGKPVIPILGRPMIAHVVERALEAGCFAEVLVATDDERIAAAARDAGAQAVMTGEASSGTDRVARRMSAIRVPRHRPRGARRARTARRCDHQHPGR